MKVIFLFISKYCHFRQRPKYYSKDRLDDIIFDISIEITPEGASNYHLLYLIECKDYAHKVPVDDLEEFKAKIDQVAGRNVKGSGSTITPNAVLETSDFFDTPRRLKEIVIHCNQLQNQK